MNDALARVEGTWSGEGGGSFPTIDSFVYRETLTIERRDKTSLFFVQKSVRATPAGTAWVTSHRESGFILQLDNDTERREPPPAPVCR